MILQIESPTLRHIYTQLETILIKGSYYRQTADFDYSGKIGAIMENYESALSAYFEENEEALEKSIREIIRVQYDVTVDYCQRKGLAVERVIA